MKTSALKLHDLGRVCRDLAWTEITSMPAMAGRLSSRCSTCEAIDWSANGLALDSLARMQLATAAATWCNAFASGYEDLFLAKRNSVDWAAAMQRVTGLEGRHLTFSSSGSTGTRKHIRHQLKNLMDEARVWANLLDCGENKSSADFRVQRVVTLVPTHHIYGFIWGVLLPTALKVPVVDAELHALPALRPGDLLVAVPDQWTWLAKARHLTQNWPDKVKGVSSTAPLHAAVHRLLTAEMTTPDTKTKPALTQLLHIYGSAETGGVAWRDDPDQPYSLAHGRIRTLTNGIALQQPNTDPAGLAVQDELDWVDLRRFNVLARLDGSVQVAGHNISLAWVSAQLASHVSVKHVTVRLDSSAELPRLKAFIVLEQADQPQLQTQIESWAAENLPWYATPASFTYGLALPTNSMGKLCDWPI